MELRKIRDILGDQAALLEHMCQTTAASSLTLPSPSYIDDVLAHSDRAPRVLAAPARMSHDRLAQHRRRVDPAGRPGHRALGRCVVRAQPADVRSQEHDGRLAQHRRRVDPAGRPGHRALSRCVVRTQPTDVHSRGHREAADRERQQRCRVALRLARRGRPQDPVHREDQPQRADVASQHVQPDAVRRRPGPRYRRAGVGATGYWDSPESHGRVKGFDKIHKKVESELTTNNAIDLTRHQVTNCYMGRIGLINSGGASRENDLRYLVKTAVNDNRAGGMGRLAGRKAFQKPFKDGVDLPHAIQDVYLAKDIRIV